MKNYLLSVLALAMTSWLGAQSITFEAAEQIFVHPSFELYDYEVEDDSPFLPFNLNNDGFTDFAGSYRESFFDRGIAIFSSNAQLDFDLTIEEYEDAYVSKIIDFDGNGVDDVMYSNHIYMPDRSESIVISDSEFDHLLEAADFNGDNKLDFVCRRVLRGGENTLMVFMSNAIDDSYSELMLDMNEEIASVEVADLNNDGLMDILAVMMFDFESEYMIIQYGNGDGTFTSQTIDAPYSDYFNVYTSIIVEDMDGDGDNDIVYNISFGGLAIYENLTGNNTKMIEFAEIGNNSLVETSGTQMFFDVEDMNNDGRPDLLVIDRIGFVYYFENLGQFTFSDFVWLGTIRTTLPYYIDDRPYSLTKLENNFYTYDFDSDGFKDVLCMEPITGIQYWFKNNGPTSSTTENLTQDHKIYPIPSKGNIWLELDGSDEYVVSIIDMQGKVLRNFKARQKTEIRDLEKGSYILNGISTSNQHDKFVKKIIVE